MQDGNTMRNNYGCDLDALGTGARIGMMRTAKGDLHYFINGQDQGAACSGLPPGKGDYSVAFDLPLSAQPTLGYQIPDFFLSYPEVYAVVDLYGQCVQVSITNATGPMDNSLATSNSATEKSFPLHSPGSASREGGHALLACCGPEGYNFQVREAVQRQAGCSSYRQKGGNNPWWEAAKKKTGGYSRYTGPGHFPAIKGPGHHELGIPGLGMSLAVVKRGVRGLEGVMAEGTFMLTSCFT